MEKIVNHNGKTHKNYANKTPKIVQLNRFFVFISFCWWPVIELFSLVCSFLNFDVKTICLFVFLLRDWINFIWWHEDAFFYFLDACSFEFLLMTNCFSYFSLMEFLLLLMMRKHLLTSWIIVALDFNLWQFVYSPFFLNGLCEIW